MSETTHLAEVIEEHFASPKGSSFAHFVTVTEGLTGEQAAQIPALRFNSIWAVTNHIAFWMELTQTTILDQAIDPSEWGLGEIGGGWPPLGEINDVNWQAARQRALAVNQALAQTIRTLNDADLERPLERLWGQKLYQALLMIYSHNSHHTSEILCIRHMMGLWVEHRDT